MILSAQSYTILFSSLEATETISDSFSPPTQMDLIMIVLLSSFVSFTKMRIYKSEQVNKPRLKRSAAFSQRNVQIY